MPMAAPRHGQQAAYGAPMQMHGQIPLQGPPAPAGTFAPGTKIQVGNHRVVIQKYLSEGGFAHVYLVKLPQPVNGTDQAVLACPHYGVFYQLINGHASQYIAKETFMT